VIRFVVTAAQEHSIRAYLGRRGKSLADRFEILRYEDLPDRNRFERGVYILSALEYLSAPMLSLVTTIHARLAAVEGFRFLNHPERTLRRFELLRELARSGRNPFRATRAGGDLSGLRYPVFLRSDRAHDGAVSPLLHSPRAVDAAIGRARLAGRRLEDLLVVEFCDTADEQGYFRKYGAFVVGDRIVPRRLECGRAWMLKREYSEFSAVMAREELEFVRANRHAGALREIADLAGVGYGCIDYAVKDDRVVVWEINLAPTLGRSPGGVSLPRTPEYQRIHVETGNLAHAAFREAFEALDTAVEGTAVDVEIDPALVGAARAASNGLPRGDGRLARVLRPARAVLDPLAAPLLPLVGRMARGRAARGRTARP
jgi:hypothetical protein